MIIMKTIHTSNINQLPGFMYQAAKEIGLSNNYRVIQCGRGLILLPDTDRTKDANEGEIIKALGFRNKVENMPSESERTTFAVNRQGEFTTMISLTPAQVRFLKWCESEDIFWDEVDFSIQKSPVIEI